MKAWRCLVCGYVHRGDEPPETCPVCGAPASDFEPYAESAAPETVETAKAVRVVIVGAGIAGLSAAESVRKTSPDAPVTLLSQEDELPYYRLNLTRLLAGEIDEAALPIHPASWYDENRIELIRGGEVVRLDVEGRAVELADGRAIAWEKLILASGASAWVPPLAGADLDGVRVLRSVADARGLAGMVRPGLRVVCIGGGILGLETAGAFARRGAEVTLLEGHDFLMPRQLCRRAGDVLGEYVEGLGIKLRRNARTKAIVGDRRAEGVELEDGSKLDADVVVVATGVRSNTRLAKGAGLEVNQGILVDHRLAASHPDVHAAGDAAEHGGVLYGSWHAAQYQGSIAGMNAAGSSVEFGGLPRSHTLKVLGLDMTSVGRFEPADGNERAVEDESGRNYRRFVFHGTRLVGGILLGDTGLASKLSKAVEQEMVFSGPPPDATTVAARLAAAHAAATG